MNGKGQAKVADFGLLPSWTLRDRAPGGGTIGYMPLEQMRQEPLDVRTDEWALASLTYEMLTGSNPFFADDLDARRRPSKRQSSCCRRCAGTSWTPRPTRSCSPLSTPTWTSATRMSPPLRPRCPIRQRQEGASGCSPTS